MRLAEEFAGLPGRGPARLEALVEAGVLPASCGAFARGELLPGAAEAGGAGTGDRLGLLLGGGSDFFVRYPEPTRAEYPSYSLLDRDPSLKRVERRGEELELGAALNWREFFSEPRLRSLVPGIERFERLLASPLVRERATIGGNIANASPVGDLTAILIALGAALRIEGPGGSRRLPLERLFLGYKRLDLLAPAEGSPGDIIAAVILPAAEPFALFNFEKLSKRERLDIAVVNTAAAFEAVTEEGGTRIARARISAGGCAPVPLFLARTSAYLAGRRVEAATALEAARIAGGEIVPIGDVRGGADYRRRALERLVLAHFVALFPGSGIEEAIA
jgi:xanthine dehydrogenase small subunit